MPNTREKLIDWLAELPDNTQVGIDAEGYQSLVAIVDSKFHMLEVGGIFPNDESDNESEEVIRRVRFDKLMAMLSRLGEINDTFKGVGTDEGAMVVTFEGYVCGLPNFFTTDYDEAFRFKSREQAESFIVAFADALMNPQVLDHP